MGDFPSFWDGALLFCGGHLALGCCPTDDESSPWYPPSWESHGQDFHYPPCEAPIDWDGHWEISTLCPFGACDGTASEIELDVTDGADCAYRQAVETSMKLGVVSIRFENGSPFTGDGAWTVWAGGVEFSMAVHAVAGMPFGYSMDVPDAAKDVVFSTAGRHEIRSRISLMWPDGIMRDRDATVWVFAFDWDDYGERGSGPCVHPYLPNAPAMVRDNDGNYTYIHIHLRGPFETFTRADEVWDGYLAEISAYADACACEVDCGDGDAGGGGDDYTAGPYDGLAGPSSTPAGGTTDCAWLLDWQVQIGNAGTSVYLQGKPYGGSWANIAGGSGSGTYSITQHSVAPCVEIRVWVTIQAGSTSNYATSWEYAPQAGTTACTETIQSNFAAVPNY